MENIGANIGEMLAVAMADGGQTIANAACRFTNMTDACCLAGMKFPRNMNNESVKLLEWFNKETSKMCEWWDENAEEVRYCMVGEILVNLLEGKGVAEIKGLVEERLSSMSNERNQVIKAARECENYDDRYGFDVNSIYLRENNWGNSRVEEAEEDWWTRRES